MILGEVVNSELFKRGFKDGIPIGISYVPLAMSLSFTAQRFGIPFGLWELQSVLLYSGSGQSALFRLLSGGETVLLMYVLTYFMIVSRHFLYSLSLSQKLDESVNIFQRLLFAPINTDEIFAVAMQQPGVLKASYLFGMAIPAYICQIIGITSGFLFTQVIPASISSAFGITLYSVFLTLIIPPMKSSKPAFTVVVLTACLSLFIEYVPAVKAYLSSGLSMILCTLITCTIGAIFFPLEKKEEEEILDRNDDLA